MDTGSRLDPVEQLYDRRVRGVCLNSTTDGSRMHLHGGCWVAACARRPARLLVAFPKEFEGAQIVVQGRRFAVSLLPPECRELNEALFAGRHSLREIGRDLFRQTPTGCPVPAGAIGYLDAALAEAIDLGDFLVAVGDLRSAALLNPDRKNLTVNEIQHRVRTGPVRLPFRGFDDTGEGLADAPVGGSDAAALERVYGRRLWGLFLAAAHHDGRDHLHVTSWAVQCSHQPPRMLLSVERSLPAAEMVRASGGFALSLLAEDQLPLALAVARGAATPRDLPGAGFRRLGGGLPVLEGAVAHFRCSAEGEFGSGSDAAGFYGPVEEFGWGRAEAPQLRADQLAAVLGGGAGAAGQAAAGSPQAPGGVAGAGRQDPAGAGTAPS